MKYIKKWFRNLAIIAYIAFVAMPFMVLWVIGTIITLGVWSVKCPLSEDSLLIKWLHYIAPEADHWLWS